MILINPCDLKQKQNKTKQNSQTATDITYDEKKDLATLTFKETIPANTKAVLDISFQGELNDQMAGFYRSTYKDAEGNTK
jgi:aminopeptidase 2